MQSLAREFVTHFAEHAARDGWVVDFVDDEDFALFVKTLGLDVNAEVGFDLTRREFGLSLNPTISVRHVPVSDLAARFFGLERGASQVGRSLSDLLRQAGRGTGVMWVLADLNDIKSTVESMLGDIQNFGQDFFLRHGSMHEILASLERSAKTYLEVGQLAVAYAVSGDRAKALSESSRLRELSTVQAPLVARQIERFLSEFDRYFASLSD